MLQLAQLSSDEIGVVRLALGLFSALFLGLVGWVAYYMRRQAERVDDHVTTLAVMRSELDGLKAELPGLRESKHKVGSLEQRLAFREGEADELCDRVTHLERRRP